MRMKEVETEIKKSLHAMLGMERGELIRRFCYETTKISQLVRVGAGTLAQERVDGEFGV
jgi:hypothetical protein